MMELMMSFSKGKRVIEEPTLSENPPAQDSGNQRDDPPYPPRFTPPHAQTSQRFHPQVMPSVYYNAPPSMGHQPTHGQFGLYSGINPAEPIHVPDLDDPKEQEKLRKDSSQTGENEKDQKKYDLLEERLRAIEGVDRFGTMDATELCLVLDVLIPAKFKVSEFENMMEQNVPWHILPWHEVVSSKKGNTPKKKERDVQAVAHDNQQAHNFNPYYPYPPYQPFYPNIGNITQNPYVYQPTPQPTFQTNVLPQTPPPRPIASTNNPGHGQRGPKTTLEKPKFDPIPVPYTTLLPQLIENRLLARTPLEPLRPPFPKWYDPNAHCDYHFGIQGHSIENCTALKHKVQALIKAGLLNFPKKDSSSVDGNPLPNHGRPTVNAIHEGMIRRVKKSIDEIQTPMDKVFEALSKINAITPEPINTKELGHDLAYSCKFHIGAIGHSIQNCDSFRGKLQELMDSSVIEFYEEAAENLEPDERYIPYYDQKWYYHRSPQPVPYKSDKAVPWNYECNILSTTSSAPQASFEDLTGVGGITRSGRCYSLEIGERVGKGKPAQGEGDLKKADTFFKDQVDESVVAPNNEVKNPVTEKETGEFLKFIKHSEYSVVEQLTKMLARISLLSLLLNSEAHRNALLKVLNQAYVSQDISVEKLNQIVGNITVGNFIAFNDEEIPSGGRGSNKALHITIKCKDHTVPRVLVDNVSALNVMLRSTLTKLPVDVSYMRTSRMVVQFQVMDIAQSYNCLLGRPWIHMAGAIPSSLHQKVKFIVEGQLISVSVKEDILAIQPSSAPYVEAIEEVQNALSDLLNLLMLLMWGKEK
ncbi:PREDICTED: uncharacterized protein LOC18586957 [Theobroma cacao]|uniref:Uncharacterized protein LOC18586957 n=1 Tax=Theobroma cacao TaxID=3641 RepID=A0AB32X2V0_THECC|nr:PREDICTED: uncharacterized protein LOC18586957 [Theobroma cacao]